MHNGCVVLHKGVGGYHQVFSVLANAELSLFYKQMESIAALCCSMPQPCGRVRLCQKARRPRQMPGRHPMIDILCQNPGLSWFYGLVVMT